jgi:hypothetical protein
MVAAGLLVMGGVAYALTIQCDGTGDQDPDPGQCAGTDEADEITGTAQRDLIFARGASTKCSRWEAKTS